MIKMRLLTFDDLIDTYTKLKQRGFKFIFSKFQLSDIQRAKSAFNHQKIQTSNWWNIPLIIERWNLLVTGDKNLDFETFIVNHFLTNKKKLKMLSLGSGSCTSELKFAQFDIFEKILCTDISEIPIKHAQNIAKTKKLKNIEFRLQDANKFDFPENQYDIVYFRASLHHFKNIDKLIGELVNYTLKDHGLLIIDEYVGPNRLQFPHEQMKSINKSIKIIPKKYRKRYKLNFYKNKSYGSGLIRMILADPSECIESSKILPAIHKSYKTIYEAPYGGNILAITLKDIAHHFILKDNEKENILKKLFEHEDLYLKTHPSDFVFGIYQKK